MEIEQRMSKGECEDAKRWEEQVHGDPDPPPGNTGGAATARQPRMKRCRSQI